MLCQYVSMSEKFCLFYGSSRIVKLRYHHIKYRVEMVYSTKVFTICDMKTKSCQQTMPSDLQNENVFSRRVWVIGAGCTHSQWGCHSWPRWWRAWACHWPCRSALHSLPVLEQGSWECHWSNMEQLKIEESTAEGWRINHWTRCPVGICA